MLTCLWEASVVTCATLPLTHTNIQMVMIKRVFNFVRIPNCSYWMTSREVLGREGGRGWREMEKNLKWKFEFLLVFLLYHPSVPVADYCIYSHESHFGAKRWIASIIFSFTLVTFNQHRFHKHPTNSVIYTVVYEGDLKMLILTFRLVIPFNFVISNQCLRRTYRLNLEIEDASRPFSIQSNFYLIEDWGDIFHQNFGNHLQVCTTS